MNVDAKTLEFKWTVSRARNTYGYNICSLYVDGKKVAAYNGGGYDMQGKSLGYYLARAYSDRLVKLTPEQMPEVTHWQRAEKPRMVCHELTNKCSGASADKDGYYPPGTETCPDCGGALMETNRDGKHVIDGRYFYGLTFHDPNFDPGKAVIGKDCDDRTFGNGSEGKTVEQAEAAGETVGLERYQAFYSASSKVPTERHTVPLIDGACGMNSVQEIAKAIGLTFEYIPVKSKKLTIYRMRDAQNKQEAA